MKKIVFLFSSLLIMAVATTAQTSKTIITTAKAPNVSYDRVARISNAMKEWVNSGWMNGGVALVIRDGKIVFYEAAGVNDLETKTPMKKDAIFRIASQTKAITSVAIMILFEEGKLLLSDPVSKYIPSYRRQVVLDKFNADDTSYTTVPATREVTIKDLLTHTSGIGYAQIGSREANAIYAKNKLTSGLGVTDESLLTAMTRLGTLPLMHQPGARWTYGLNTDLLGCLVEVISGMTLDDFFRTKIFVPLGMKDTYFRIPDSKGDRLVNLYYEDSTGKLIKSPGAVLNSVSVANYPLKNSTYYSGGAGLSSTIMDYAIFLQMLLNGGEYGSKRILSHNAVRMMTINQIGDLALGDNKFGLGFSVITEKGSGAVPAQVGTFSWGGAFATSYWVDPKEKLVMLFYRQLQRTTHGDVVEKFRALTYSALE